MGTDAHTPVRIRPSAQERERVVKVLRDRSVEGRLSTDTFAERVGRADAAQSGAELAELTSTEPNAVIGRAPNCDCVLTEDRVSRRHAHSWRDGDRWFIRDLGSLNGTRVNGMRVIDRAEVRPGDRVWLAERPTACAHALSEARTAQPRTDEASAPAMNGASRSRNSRSCSCIRPG